MADKLREKKRNAWNYKHEQGTVLRAPNYRQSPQKNLARNCFESTQLQGVPQKNLRFFFSYKNNLCIAERSLISAQMQR